MSKVQSGDNKGPHKVSTMLKESHEIVDLQHVMICSMVIMMIIAVKDQRVENCCRT